MSYLPFRTGSVKRIVGRLSVVSAGVGVLIFGLTGESSETRAQGYYGYGYYQPFYGYYQPRRRYTRPRYRRNRVRRSRPKRTPIPAPKWAANDGSKDPVQIVVSLPDQKLTVYQGDKALTTSRVSSGKPGYSTPSGVFSILQKNRHHRSNIYSGAPMPFMQRLTWSGIALHASNSVPRHPASHGCVRLPHAFAGQLFRFTEMGAHVVIANEKEVKPFEITHENLLQPRTPAPKDFDQIEEERVARANGVKVKEKKRSTEPVRILITRRTGKEQIKDVQRLLNELSFGAGDVDGYMGPDTAKSIRRFQKTYGLPADGLISDHLIEKIYEVAAAGKPMNGHLYVRQNFNPVFDMPVFIKGGDTPLGSHLFTAQHFYPTADHARWLAVTLKKGSPTNRYARYSRRKKKKVVDDVVLTANAPIAATAVEALDRVEIPKRARARLEKMLTPGSSLAITNDGISKETTPKGTDFVVLMQ
ncbi:MAG: L,D-transpeptidase family protein [Hyphomicrobiaceae bacterium]|nr:L,D-transpeptidase family protein [Hyphomicrobiaceae bacterium]